MHEGHDSSPSSLGATYLNQIDHVLTEEAATDPPLKRAQKFMHHILNDSEIGMWCSYFNGESCSRQ